MTRVKDESEGDDQQSKDGGVVLNQGIHGGKEKPLGYLTSKKVRGK
jgi:hypothetical protein